MSATQPQRNGRPSRTRPAVAAAAAVVGAAAVAAATLAFAVARDDGEKVRPVTPEARTLMREYGISAEDAEARVARQPAIEDLGAYLESHVPDAFGGMWVDHARGGRIRVGVTRPGVTSGLAKRFGLPPRLVVEFRVKRTFRRLLAIHDDAVERARAEIENPALRPGIGTDERTNTVVVQLPDASSPAVAPYVSRLRADYGDAIRVVGGAPNVIIPAAATPPREPHEVWKTSGSGFTAAATGRLYGDAANRCAWLGGRRSGAVVHWPARYRVRFRPLRVVVARTGRVVAREGDWILTGGGGRDRRIAGCPRADGEWFPSSLEFWGRTKPPP